MLSSTYGQIVKGVKAGASWAAKQASKFPSDARMRIGVGAIAGSAGGPIGTVAGATAGLISKPLFKGAKALVNSRPSKYISGSRMGKWAGRQMTPVKTGAALGLALGTAGAGLALGTRTLRQINNNMQPQGGVGASTSSRGYVSWTSGRSEGMSPEHLGASGGLALALHRTRHRLNLHRTGYS
jgi:hypothetical protein